MILPSAQTSVLPVDFSWHQSSVATMLRCPKRFWFRYAIQALVDHSASDYANVLGTADHGGCELILECANEGVVVSRETLRDHVLDVFGEALQRAQDKGEHTDPDGLDRAVDRLEGERLDRLMALANDPRIRAVDWKGIEWQFKFTEEEGRNWQGTLDVWGIAKRDVEDFGALGRDPVMIRAGDGLIVDWKTGEAPPFGHVERTQHVQLGTYAMALANDPEVEPPPSGRWRTFLGIIHDLDRPKAPSDESGKRIPKHLPKRINPAFVSELCLSDEEAARSKRRPKDSRGDHIPKWAPEKANPAFELACSRPKGPLFREARIQFDLVLETIRAAIRQAELGLFPASGALTGQCGRCSYASICTNSNEDDTA